MIGEHIKSGIIPTKEVSSEPELENEDKEAIRDVERAGRENERIVNEHMRTEKGKNFLFWTLTTFFLLIAISICSAVFTLSWHYLAPYDWKWLEDPEIEIVKNFVLSGSIVGVLQLSITRLLHRYFNNIK